jgi:hypothetical protein
MSQKRIKRSIRPFRPVRVPQEFIDDGNRTILREARERIVPIRVAVLFLTRPDKPDSPVMWTPEFGDNAGLDEIEEILHEMLPFTKIGEGFRSCIMEVQP